MVVFGVAAFACAAASLSTLLKHDKSTLIVAESELYSWNPFAACFKFEIASFLFFIYD